MLHPYNAFMRCWREMPSITEMQYYRSRIVLHMAYLLIILACRSGIMSRIFASVSHICGHDRDVEGQCLPRDLPGDGREA